MELWMAVSWETVELVYRKSTAWYPQGRKRSMTFLRSVSVYCCSRLNAPTTMAEKTLTRVYPPSAVGLVVITPSTYLRESYGCGPEEIQMIRIGNYLLHLFGPRQVLSDQETILHLLGLVPHRQDTFLFGSPLGNNFVQFLSHPSRDNHEGRFIIDRKIKFCLSTDSGNIFIFLVTKLLNYIAHRDNTSFA